MINLKDYIVEVGDEEYVPLKVAQAAVDEAYEFNKYKEKLDEAMAEFKTAMKDINSISNEVND